MNLIIAGDVVPTEKNICYFEKDLLNYLEDDFKKLWNSSDFRIFNLECPIIDYGTPIPKYGPSLRCENKSIKGISSLNPSLVLLGNNHINDYGVEGIDNTIKQLKSVNIDYTGIINNYNDNNDGYIFMKDGIKVGIYNFADNEFSQATMKQKGVRGISFLKNYQEIIKLKLKVDYLIILFHGGKEYYQYQSPKLQELTELLVEWGANIVICQHSHCIGTISKYKGATIIYGQGNFIFDDGNNPLEKYSLVINIKFTKENYYIDYIPVEKFNGLIRLTDKLFMNSIKKRNDETKKIAEVYDKFEDFSFQKINEYARIFSKPNLIKKIINRFFIKNYYIRSYSKKDLLKILNVIECEAHREVLLTSLKKYIESDD